MKITDSTDAQSLAAAINALESAYGLPDQYARWDAVQEATNRLRTAFKAATGWTLYRKCGAWLTRR